jgi:pSer/pThr/pTyr-binding forkhead associated (FHA) protein
MANTDDSPPSESGETADGDSSGDTDHGGRHEEEKPRNDSGPPSPADLDVGTSESSDSSSDSGFSLPEPSTDDSDGDDGDDDTADTNSSMGLSLPDPSSVVEVAAEADSDETDGLDADSATDGEEDVAERETSSSSDGNETMLGLGAVPESSGEPDEASPRPEDQPVSTSETPAEASTSNSSANETMLGLGAVPDSSSDSDDTPTEPAPPSEPTAETRAPDVDSGPDRLESSSEPTQETRAPNVEADNDPQPTSEPTAESQSPAIENDDEPPQSPSEPTTETESPEVGPPDDEFDAPDTELFTGPPDAPTDESGSALSDVADEMTREDQRDSGLHDEPDSAVDGEFDASDATVVSDQKFGINPSADGAIDGTVEAAAPQTTPDDDETPAPEPTTDTGTVEKSAPRVGGHSSSTNSGADSAPSPSGPSDASRPPSDSWPTSQNPPPEQDPHTSRDSGGDSAPTAEVAQEALEEEGEFDAQETDLFDSPFENDPLCPRLMVLEGPSSGQEFLLNKLRNSVGRATSNTVTLPDEAMSRQHLEIVQNPDDTYTLKDLQSINGTYLNGTKIREADLFHGDRIEVGQTTLQFGIPGQQPDAEDRDRRVVQAPQDQPDEARAPDHPTAAPLDDESTDDSLTVWLNRVIVGALLALIPLGATFAYLSLQSSDARKEKSASRNARAAYLAGVDAVKRRKWDKARNQFERARKLDPDLSKVDDQLDRIESERKARQALADAREALDGGDGDQALKQAKSIPRESVYYEDARQIIRRQERRQRISSLYSDADEQFDGGNHQEALATLQRILETNPNHERALELRRRILEKTEADLERAKKEAEAEKEKKAREREEQRRRERDEERRARRRKNADDSAAGGEAADSDEESWLLDDSSEGGAGSTADSAESKTGDSGEPVNFTKGFSLYQRQEFEAAITHFEQAAEQSEGAVSERAADAAGDIRKFQRHYRAARKALASEKWQKATRQFRRAQTADTKVADARYFSQQINEGLTGATAGLGLQHAESGRYVEAFEAYRKARQKEGSDARVRELRRALENRARSLYIKAAAERKTNPEKARSLCEEITSIVPKSNEYHQKARKLREDL